MFIWGFLYCHINVECDDYIDGNDSNKSAHQCQGMGRQFGYTCSKISIKFNLRTK
jgi:hypothetical protein